MTAHVELHLRMKGFFSAASVALESHQRQRWRWKTHQHGGTSWDFSWFFSGDLELHGIFADFFQISWGLMDVFMDFMGYFKMDLDIHGEIRGVV